MKISYLLVSVLVLAGTHYVLAQNDDEDCHVTNIQLFFGNEYSYFGTPNNRSEPSAILTWRTHDVCEGMTLKVDGDKLNNHVGNFKARVEKYSADLPSGREPYTFNTHVVEIPEIAKEVQYSAQISNKGELETFFYFRLPRKGGKDNEGVKFVVYGNLGLPDSSNDTVDALSQYYTRNFPSLSGAIDLGNSVLRLEERNGRDADIYFSQLDPIDYLLPTIYLNNEENTNEGTDIFNNIVRNPNYLKTSNNYFSVNIGHIHFIHYNIDYYAQLSKEGKAEMLDWIKNDLKVANNRRHDFPWIVAISHHSLYCSYDSVDGESAVHCHKLYYERQFWDEIHHLGGIDLHLSAEIPAYERSHGIYKNSIVTSRHYTYNHTFNDPNSTIYIVEGAAGEVVTKTALKYHLEDYTLEADSNAGYGILSNPSKYTLTYEHFDTKHRLIDQVTINKGVKQPDMGSYYLIYIAIALAGWYFYTNKRVRNQDQPKRREQQRADQEVPLVERS